MLQKSCSQFTAQLIFHQKPYSLWLGYIKLPAIRFVQGNQIHVTDALHACGWKHIFFWCSQNMCICALVHMSDGYLWHVASVLVPPENFCRRDDYRSIHYVTLPADQLKWKLNRHATLCYNISLYLYVGVCVCVSRRKVYFPNLTFCVKMLVWKADKKK